MPSVAKKFRGTAGGSFGISVRNLSQVIRKIDAAGKKFERGIIIAANVIGIIVEAEAKRLVRNGYYRPAILTGTLRRNITHRRIKANPYEIAVEVGLSGVPYAIYVHEGTYFMERRPFLSDALANKKREILAVIRKAYGFSIGI